MYLFLQSFQRKNERKIEYAMKLLEILEKRTSNGDYNKDVVSWLNEEAKKIIRDASSHLEYVRNVLVEFDMHNVKHSEAVLKIIEDLLGDKAENLSSYDLFSLIAVSYLHDCGMALSDFEINVMKLVEKDDYDGKKLCTKDQALDLIEKNKTIVFKSKDDVKDVKDWLFYPGSDEKLFDYYSQLLIDYQSFRNGKIDRIKESNNPEKTNNELRTDYVRRTHAERAETYIKTWGETRFLDFPTKSLGKRLANKIAMVCKAHGETDDYVRGELEKKVMYVGSETSNLQFVAMMLRIGDIVHFSYDRAPIELRAMHHFESDYSHEQWRIKSDSGVNYSISKNGEISYSAYCIIPQDYYDLMKYVDGIDNELVLYNRLRNEEQWEDIYPALTKYKVNRDNIAHDDSFNPVPNLKFTLEQNRILDLLMGARLYSDEYACLRELYQNSLDACRCQMAADEAHGKASVGKIEFGIETDKEGKKYVYCLDNGKGMSKHIIENYLLKIGSSYYKSSDFYQSQAATGNKFTPTSQFGIGILSCFMIGDKLEITTKEESGEYISCVMENIHECFYYKKDSASEDKDLIPSSGTLIKIYLNDEYKEIMTDEYISNIGFLAWKSQYDTDHILNSHARPYYHHLFTIINRFVKVVSDGIELNVKMSNDEKIKIRNKPVLLGEDVFAVSEDDKNKHLIDSLKNGDYLPLVVESDGIQLRTILNIPVDIDDTKIGYLLFDDDCICVDGIGTYRVSYKTNSPSDMINKSSILLNFTGEERPQLSISRDSIADFKEKRFEEKLRVLLGDLMKQAIDEITQYISREEISQESDRYYIIWRSFFERFGEIPVSIYAKHFLAEPIKDYFMPFSKVISNNMTFGSFFRENTCFKNYYYHESFDIFESLITNRIVCSKEVSYSEIGVSLIGYEQDVIKEKKWNTQNISVSWRLFYDYDIVSHLYPFISQGLFGHFSKDRHPSSWTGRALIRFVDIVSNDIFDANMPMGKAFMNFLTEHREDLKALENSMTEYINYLQILASEYINNNRISFLRSLHNLYFSSHAEKIAITMFSTTLKSVFENVLLSSKKMDETCSDGGMLGLSVILFGWNDFYVIPGYLSRQEQVDKIPDDIWNSLKLEEYQFADGTPLKRSQKN